MRTTDDIVEYEQDMSLSDEREPIIANEKGKSEIVNYVYSENKGKKVYYKKIGGRK